MITSDPTALVEQRLQVMAESSVEDEATAQQALAYALSAVGTMNQHLMSTQQSAATLQGPIDDIVKLYVMERPAPVQQERRGSFTM